MLKKFVEIIEEKRNALGMTKAELCRRSKITEQQYYNITHGKNSRVTTIEDILRVLEVKKIKIEL